MIVGKAAILKYFESIGEAYFAIFYKGQIEKGNPIFRNDKDAEKEFTPAEAKESFERTLELLQYGDYSVVISDKKNVTNRGNNRVDFKIGLNEAAPANQGAPAPNYSPAIGGLTMEDVEKKANEIAAKQFQQLMDKKELTDTKAKLVELEKENRELETRVNEPWNKFITAAAPHSETIIAGLMGNGAGRTATAHVPLSGVEADSIDGPDVTAQQTIENFVTALAERKPNDWQAILQRFTDLIKNDPNKFETALTFL